MPAYEKPPARRADVYFPQRTRRGDCKIARMSCTVPVKNAAPACRRRGGACVKHDMVYMLCHNMVYTFSFLGSSDRR